MQSRVERESARRGLRSWPSPRPPLESPGEQEYSRVSKPSRYAIVHLRARLWAEALAEVPGVSAASPAPGLLDDERQWGRFDRAVTIRSARDGTLALLLLERDVPVEGQEDTLAVLHIAVDVPQASVAVLPDCGCDACDSGSQDLLEAVDDAIRRVVGGPFVFLLGRQWQAYWHPDGGGSAGAGRGPDHGQVMHWCQRLAAGDRPRLPKDVRAFVGRSWFD